MVQRTCEHGRYTGMLIEGHDMVDIRLAETISGRSAYIAMIKSCFIILIISPSIFYAILPAQKFWEQSRIQFAIC